ncbi:MAG: DUF2892 domain-containing protein [Pseudomonadota bacterium]
MIKNMGTLDRGGRLAIALVLAVLALGTGTLQGALFYIALAVAAIFAVTAFVGNCPLYQIIGLKTCKDC